MSHWHEPKKEDIEINGDEIDIYLFNDDFGSVYCTLKVKDIQEVLAEYEKRRSTTQLNTAEGS